MTAGKKLYKKLVTHLTWCIMAAAPAVVLEASAASYAKLSISKSGTGSGTVASSSSGISCGSDCSQRYVVGSSITLTATAKSGSTFGGWSGSCSGTAASVKIVVNNAATCVATFKPSATVPPPAATYSLTISKAGTGSGTVATSPAGVSCGSACVANFPANTSVTLTATAASGSTFSGWSGHCSGTAPNFTGVLSLNAGCTATFTATAAPAAPPPVTTASLFVTLGGTGGGTVGSSPAGISCGSVCSATLPLNTAVTLTAAPASGSAFAGWSGSCSGSAASTVIALSATSTCSATFNTTAPTMVSLGITKSGTGSGTVTSSPAGIDCGSICTASAVKDAAVTLTATPAIGSTFAGWTGSCAGNVASITLVPSASTSCTAAFTASVAVGGAYYVATNGNDATGTGTIANPWKTISYGIGRMAAGDTLIVRNGVYTGKVNFITNVKSGTASRPTTVMAETPMEVRIVSDTSLLYYDNQLSIGGNYINVDGFIYDMSGTVYPEYIGDVSGSYNKITRSIFKRSGSIDKYGGLFFVSGNDNLIEDVAGTGACRYCFAQGGPSSSTQRTIWRRLVGRMDYSGSNQPKATFASYGNDNSPVMRDHLYQNVIAIDGQNPAGLGGEEKYGGFYTPKTAANVRLFGSMVLNEGVAHTGLFLREFGSVNSAYHSVIWDLRGSTYATGIKANNADHMTIGGNIPGAATDLIVAATASLLKPVTKPANLLNNTNGAVIMKRYGVTGTRWGEPGYDQLTDEDLWPWPYEARIKAVFREVNDPPAGNSPATNNTKRGFAADGLGLYGGPVTLTSYIWEYLGTPCPASVCR